MISKEVLPRRGLSKKAAFFGSVVASIATACSSGEKEAEITPESSPTQTPVASSVYEPPVMKLEGVFSPYAKDGFNENETRLLNFLFTVWQSDDIPEFLKPREEEQKWLVAKFPNGITDSDIAYLKFLYGLEKPSQIKPERLLTAIWGYFFPQDAEHRMKFLESGLLNHLPPEAYQTIPLYTKEVLNYYSQWLNADGIMIEASVNIDPQALEITKETVNQMLAFRPDIRSRMIERGARVAIIADNEKLTDLPEHRDKVGLKAFDGTAYEGIRGAGGIPEDPVTAIGEETILKLDGPERNFIHHGFGHGVMDLGMADGERQEWKKNYDDSKSSGAWNGSYTISNEHEFFAVLSTIYFNSDPQVPVLGSTIEVNTAERLKSFDPKAFEFLRKIYGPVE